VNPCCGLFPAVAAPASPWGGQATATAVSTDRPAPGAQDHRPGGDAAGSFLQWVRQMAHPVAPAGQADPNLSHRAGGHPSADGTDGERRSQAGVWLMHTVPSGQPAAEAADVERGDPGATGLAPIEAVLGPIGTAAGQRQGDGSLLPPGLSPVVPFMPAPQRASAGEPPQAPAAGPSLHNHDAATPVPGAQGGQPPMIPGRPIDWAAGVDASPDGVEPRPSRTLTQGFGPNGGDHPSGPGRNISEPSALSMAVSNNAVSAAAPQKDPGTAQILAAPGPASVANWPKMAAPSDEGGHRNGKASPNRTARGEIASTDSARSQPAQTSFSIPNSTAEPSQPLLAVNDTAKAAAGEPATPGAARHSAGQAGVFPAGDASAAKGFHATVMDQIVDQASMRSIQGHSAIQIRLKPDFLGRVQLTIASDKGQLVVRIQTDQPAVKAIIESNLSLLKTELQHQGVTISRFDVTVNPDAHNQSNREPLAQMFNNDSFQNGRRQPGQPDPDQESWSHEGTGASGRNRPDSEGINYFA
jgi:hypothetical protein